MTIAFIITLCTLLLIAYTFELTASRTKIPSVLLLLFLGYGVKRITDFVHIEIPDLSGLLPILGTIGLIVIVLEGALDLELNRSKFSLVRKSLTVAFVPMLFMGFALAFAFNYFGGYGFKNSLTSAIPLCVISSAIAIPSVKYLTKKNKEFVIYESSMSDILGVLFFNFVALNVTIDFQSFLWFVFHLIIISIISFIATIGLSFLLSKIDHHIKFAPIIVLVILIYAVSKVYHLPALIFILLFGLFIGNLDELKHFKWIKRLNPDALDKEVHKFKEILIEATFIIRALFFLLFGFLINTSELLNQETLVWAGAIVGGIFVFRWIQLKLSGLPAMPLVFIAPRGLITILLFLAIDVENRIAIVGKPLIVQVIILSGVVLMIGLIVSKKKKEKVEGATDELALDSGVKETTKE
jgi:Kef-type K+ transport system membrane component KefB